LKAIIMAGGKGTRLRPISENIPKPMVDLFGKPVMEYTVEHLRKNGIYNICATLHYLPNVIKDYFRNGTDFGVNMTYSVEDAPLGTAGSVRKSEFYKGETEPVLIISGDGVCDFNLMDSIKRHKQRNADVTILLKSCENPLEYGIVMTDAEGRIEKFLEKPCWSQAFGDTVNTGIYIINPNILELIPEGVEYDFSKDLFGKLISDGYKIYGDTCEGYWCDMGNPEAYVRCICDILDGKTKINIPASHMVNGVYTNSAIRRGVQVTAPCYIGENVVLENGCRIGPYAVLNDNCEIRAGATAEKSVISHSKICENAVIEGAVVMKNCVIGRSARLCEGSVVGESCTIEENEVVLNGEKVTAKRSLKKQSLLLDDCGVICGNVSAEYMLKLGADIEQKNVVVGCDNSKESMVLRNALCCGIMRDGGNVLVSDADFAALFKNDIKSLGIDVNIFIKSENNANKIMFFDKDGRAIGRESIKKINKSQKEHKSEDFKKKEIGDIKFTTGSKERYLGKNTRKVKGKEIQVFVPETDEANAVLGKLLNRCKIEISCEKGACFMVDEDGTAAFAIDENKNRVSEEKLNTVCAYIAATECSDDIGVPFDFPYSAEIVAQQLGKKILREGRDEDALNHMPHMMSDGILKVVWICEYMAKNNCTLLSLCEKTPSIFVKEKEVEVASSRAKVMRQIVSLSNEEDRMLYNGMRVKTEGGWAHITPLCDKNAIRIVAESQKAEIAEEMCISIEEYIKKLDGNVIRS